VAYNDAIRFVMAFIPFHSTDFAGTQGKKNVRFYSIALCSCFDSSSRFCLGIVSSGTGAERGSIRMAACLSSFLT
jgi:hypothetical protein